MARRAEAEGVQTGTDPASCSHSQTGTASGVSLTVGAGCRRLLLSSSESTLPHRSPPKLRPEALLWLIAMR
jgi:hypothetical protein